MGDETEKMGWLRKVDLNKALENGSFFHSHLHTLNPAELSWFLTFRDSCATPRRLQSILEGQIHHECQCSSSQLSAAGRGTRGSYNILYVCMLHCILLIRDGFLFLYDDMTSNICILAIFLMFHGIGFGVLSN